MKNNPPISEKKKQWLGDRTNIALRGSKLNYNAGDQTQYVKELTALVRQMTEQVQREIVRFFKGETAEEFYDQQKEAAAMDASVASQAKILTDKLTAKFEALFDRKGKTIAERMVKNAETTSASNLKTSLKKLSGGLTLNTKTLGAGTKEIYAASVTENVSLIKKIAQKYLADVQEAVMRSITTASGLKYLIPQIEKFKKHSQAHAKNVALDQTRKVYNSINKTRMQANGVKQFEWVHSGGGQKPRESHIRLNGKIFSFDDLPVINQEQVNGGYEGPVRGIPGQAINCRCTMIPVIEFDEGD